MSKVSMSEFDVMIDRKSVLLVEDCPDSAKLVMAALKELRLEIIWVKSFAEGVGVLKKRGSIELILLDVELDGDTDSKNGIDLLVEIKSDYETLKIPVMMLTGVKDTEAVKRALSLGVRDYIIKPFTPWDLENRVKKVI